MSGRAGKIHLRTGSAYNWTDQEIQWLRDNTNMPIEEQAKHLNRSIHAVRNAKQRHKIPNMKKQKTRVKYLYHHHTPECSGIDPIVIDRIVAAGTIQQFALQHPVCDCERAYILKYVPNAYQILLEPRKEVQQRLNAIPV